jgi:cold shock CspA family protein
MNGYGTIETIYRPLGMGIIKSVEQNKPNVIFTSASVQGGVDGFHQLVEGETVNYRTFQDAVGGHALARDVWKRPEPGGGANPYDR